MYINERDQINYHGFLRALREMNKVTQEAVSIGICTVSGMNRFENGNRIAEKLMRDRLTARLGISGEKYEDYLQRSEYTRWQHRLRLIKAIENRDLPSAKAELSAYEVLPELNTPNKQFVETMRYMILSLENASSDELLDCISRAIQYTVPNIKEALDGKHLLADQEINLIAEYMRLLPPQSVVRDEKDWRISEYEKLISYIDNSQWEVLQKAKIYPKVTYYICQLLLENEPNEAELRHGLELCHNAIEMLRDSRRLYYFVELTELRRSLAERLLGCFEMTDSEKSAIQEMIEENNTWEKVFKELYTEYEVALYMSDFCYLYYETECHDMAEVIETRRRMLKLSRVKLGEGICTDRTLIRIEREDRDANIEVVRRLFEKMGLCAEYRRARVITNDVNALMLSIEVTRSMNIYDFESWDKNISILEEKLNMNILHNKQEIDRLKMLLNYRRKNIDKEQLNGQMESTLEYTVPLKSISKKGRRYYTRNEWLCIYDFAFKSSGSTSNGSLKIIEEFCSEIENRKNILSICLYEVIMAGMINYLGNVGKYAESIRLSKIMIKECLVYRRMYDLDINTYNILWCALEERKITKPNCNKKMIKESIQFCKVLSEVSKAYNRVAFFEEKLL